LDIIPISTPIITTVFDSMERVGVLSDPGEGADGGAPIQRTHSEKRSMFKRFFSRSDSVKKHDKKEKHHAEKELNRK